MSNKRALELVPDYVLGTLGSAERQEVDEELGRSPELRAEVAAISEAFGVLGQALPSVTPPPRIKSRLMQSIMTPVEKLSPFALPLTRYFDLGIERVRELLNAIFDPSTTWNPGPIPGISLMDFDGGPKCATADVGFVRLPAGLEFPWHRHNGHEINFVLEGSIQDSDGRIIGPGEANEKHVGSEHSFKVVSEGGVLLAVVVFEGFEILYKK